MTLLRLNSRSVTFLQLPGARLHPPAGGLGGEAHAAHHAQLAEDAAQVGARRVVSADPPAAPEPADQPHVVPAGSRTVTLMRLKKFVSAIMRMIADRPSSSKWSATSSQISSVTGSLRSAQPGGRLGESERRALGVGEVRRVAPVRRSPTSRSSVSPSCLAGRACRVQAHRAPVDLAGAHVDELERGVRDAALAAALTSLHGRHRVRKDHTRGASFVRSMRSPCHIGRVRSSGMTETAERM